MITERYQGKSKFISASPTSLTLLKDIYNLECVFDKFDPAVGGLLFVYAFNKYLLSTYYISNIVQALGIEQMNKRDKMHKWIYYRN